MWRNPLQVCGIFSLEVKAAGCGGWPVLPVTTGLQFEAGLYNGNSFSNKKDKTWFSFENGQLSHPCHPFHRMGMVSLIKAKSEL